ncbi:BTB/POZ domain-containing protein-like [Dorcoceras hygrometricum]|uniref:BTB/POZ domain-containing protein-like n=1 Tax=Dorcoceras hygrometricum TaxID=472368 RepID=A0A2Z7AY06_9LAMI|nr:BTB/POZ domain-containing protein-like [Dorcoceras hygrometricum]
MVNQIKRRNVSSLTYENFPGGHQSQYCSHPCTLNSTQSGPSTDYLTASVGGALRSIDRLPHTLF